MTQSLVPMDELSAVNGMLAAIGESPVSTLSISGLDDVATAKADLERVSREVQTRGWWFNEDYNYPLVPNVSNEIEVPDNALNIDAEDDDFRYVDRGGKLWDREEHTFTITDTIKVHIIWMFQFENLPQAARHYIYAKARREFQQGILGSKNVDDFVANDEANAMIEIERIDLKNADVNINKSDIGYHVIHKRNILR